MKVYALSGKSGTGKSYQAMNLCKDMGIESIIDDGLFIYKNEIIAGKSAKREATKVGAIKTALFYDEAHRDEVAAAICDIAPDSILVLGTSDRMVDKIAARLDLPVPQEHIHIEDITSEAEREIAYRQRKIQGKHIVPAPAMQLKRQFSGYFMHPIRIFKGWGFGRDNVDEKSVVRPSYSYLGNFIISDRVIADIVDRIAERMYGVVSTGRAIVVKKADGLNVVIPATMSMNSNVFENAMNLQDRCARMIEEMTAFNIKSIDVEIRSVK